MLLASSNIRPPALHFTSRLNAEFAECRGLRSLEFHSFLQHVLLCFKRLFWLAIRSPTVLLDTKQPLRLRKSYGTPRQHFAFGPQLPHQLSAEACQTSITDQGDEGRKLGIASV